MAQIKYNLGSVNNDYEDITTQCFFNPSYFGGDNGKMPKVYKNYNSIVIDWNMTILKAVESTSLLTGIINIPIEEDNIQFLGNQTHVDLSYGGTPVGLALLQIVNIPDTTTGLMLSIRNTLFTGNMTLGRDTLRGTSVFNFVRLKS